MLFLSKPVFQTGIWKQQEQYELNLSTKGNRNYTINPAVNITQSDIDGMQTPFEISGAGFESMQYLECRTNLKKINIKLNGCSGLLQPDGDNGGKGIIDFSLSIRYGNDFATANNIVLLSKQLRQSSSDFSFTPTDYNVGIDSLVRGDKVWICYQFTMNETTLLGRLECFGFINIESINITAESSSYSSVVPSFRLIDVMRQVVKSTSGLDISAPRFAAGGEFYNNRLVNGNFLRNAIYNTDGTQKPFYISLEDIEKSITEMNADHEIDADGKVFFGTENDFYTTYESGFFNNTQFSEMNKVFNPRFTVNEFSYKYKNYQALKENEELNSADNVHGEAKYVFFI